MFIAIYVILSIVNNSTEVPAWILAAVGIVAFIEAAWYVFMIVIMIIGAILERVQR